MTKKALGAAGMRDLSKQEILIAARDRMASINGSKFVCKNIMEFANSSKYISNGTKARAKELCHWIKHDLLEGSDTLEHWLADRHLHGSPYLRRQLRLRWLDWMITYWKKEETK